jgi:hypothetical protein
VSQGESQESVCEILFWLSFKQYFAAGFQQLPILDAGRTNLFTGAATETTVDMSLECR